MSTLLKRLNSKKKNSLILIDFIDEFKDEKIYIKRMSSKDMFAYSTLDKEELNSLDNYVDCVSRCIVDEKGSPVFDDDEGKEYLKDMAFIDLSELFKASTKTITSKDLDGVKKK